MIVIVCKSMAFRQRISSLSAGSDRGDKIRSLQASEDPFSLLDQTEEMEFGSLKATVHCGAVRKPMRTARKQANQEQQNDRGRGTRDNHSGGGPLLLHKIESANRNVRAVRAWKTLKI